MRITPLFPELRQLLVAWKLGSPFTDPGDYVLVTASRGPVQQRNAQRVLAKTKQAAGLDACEATSHGTAFTTARVRSGSPSTALGHANPSFTLACYGRNPRDTETMVADVLPRAAAVETQLQPQSLSAPSKRARLLKRKAPKRGLFSRADEGTRTLDLLHGKPCRRPRRLTTVDY